MNTVYGPNIVRDGLKIYLDGGSTKKTPTKNLLQKTEELTDSSKWITSSFSNGDSTTHIREEGYDNHINSKYWLISSSYIDSNSNSGAVTIYNLPRIHQSVDESEFETTDADTIRAFSIYLKKGTHSRVLVGTATSIGWPNHVLLDLENGSIVNNRLTTYSGSITQLNLTEKENGWYLFEGSYFVDDYGFTPQYNSSRNNGILIALANPTTDNASNARYPTGSGNIYSGSEFIYVAKPQLEDRHFCTPYVEGERSFTTDYDWYDLSGNGNNATFNNDKNELEIGFVPSRKVRVGGYFDFDRVELQGNIYQSGSSLDFGDFFGGQPAYDYTISTWVTEEFGFATGGSSNERLFFNIRQVGEFSINSSNPYVDQNNTKQYDSFTLKNSDGITLPNTEWKNYCLVNNNLERKVYINGNLVYTHNNINVNDGIPGNTTTLMRGGGSGQQRYSGSLASFSFYDRALTEEEVQQNFYVLKDRYI